MPLELIRFPTRRSQATQREKVCRALIEVLDALYSTARNVTGSSELAEDLVHETTRKALEGAAGLQHDRHLRAWLFRVLLNTIRDHLRRQKAWGETEIDAKTDALSAGTFSMSAAVDVQNALSALPPPARAVIVLVDVEEFTVLEAASILGIPPGTVCSRLARARDRLRQDLRIYRGRVSGQGGTP